MGYCMHQEWEINLVNQPKLVYFCKPIKILSTQQPNPILIHKPPRIRLVIPEEVVMQPGLFIIILVLQSEGLVCVIRYLGFVFSLPQPL